MPAGRPRLVTDPLVERAVELRRDGYRVEAIAAQLGVSKRTTQRALARTRAPSGPRLGDTAAEVSPAPDEAALVASVTRAARNDWRAAAWLLERLAPERWASPARRSLEVVAAPPLDGVFAELDELSRRRRERRES